MESQPKNPEFRNNPEKFHPWTCFSSESSDSHEMASLIFHEN